MFFYLKPSFLIFLLFFFSQNVLSNGGVGWLCSEYCVSDSEVTCEDEGDDCSCGKGYKYSKKCEVATHVRFRGGESEENGVLSEYSAFKDSFGGTFQTTNEHEMGTYYVDTEGLVYQLKSLREINPELIEQLGLLSEVQDFRGATIKGDPPLNPYNISSTTVAEGQTLNIEVFNTCSDETCFRETASNCGGENSHFHKETIEVKSVSDDETTFQSTVPGEGNTTVTLCDYGVFRDLGAPITDQEGHLLGIASMSGWPYASTHGSSVGPPTDLCWNMTEVWRAPLCDRSCTIGLSVGLPTVVAIGTGVYIAKHRKAVGKTLTRWKRRLMRNPVSQVRTLHHQYIRAKKDGTLPKPLNDGKP